ncbi:caspase family protein [Streptomyces sp. 15-116A]|uniref:caspase, EACC1-associated type n=1 Tax=Streptomyces sp. 15-116A TaxID=2259035 RepID=UPI0021B3ED60|nr:caspase family protein [Streptomyces sp. 15-116A]MCT7352674.1 caspase family protein [Streptomyces sp. 15-116A]
MSGGRFALLIATGRYENPALRQLRSPVRDAEGLAEVLRDPGIGGFEVSTVVDRRHHEVARAIEHFFLDRGRDDLLLLHLSSHGVKNDDGELYFAAADTDRRLLASTAVSAEFLRTRMSRCRARSIVLLLDCCYSGAFLPGAKGDTDVHLKDELAGSGRVVLTATNRTEYAWEGERLDALDPEPSRFTGAVIKGLRSGEADGNGDGLISAQDLYEYVYDELRAAQVRQRPLMWAEVERQVVIARSVATAPRRPVIPAQPEAEAQSPRGNPESPAPRLPLNRTVNLTNELSGLTCMADAQSRVQFGSVLGEQLGRRIDLRGLRLREDVVVMVRTVLNTPGGERVLEAVIEIFEGAGAADRVRHLLDGGGAAPSRDRTTTDRSPRRPRPPFDEVRANAHSLAEDSDYWGATELLRRLTDALTHVPSMEDPQGRILVASLLGEQLGRPVDLRGVRLREDAVALVRAALNAPDGERVLIDVIRVVDGEAMAADVERSIQPVR